MISLGHELKSKTATSREPGRTNNKRRNGEVELPSSLTRGRNYPSHLQQVRSVQGRTQRVLISEAVAIVPGERLSIYQEKPMFEKATKTQSRLRLALCGPSGSGKTYSALNIAQHLGQTIAVIDTEHRSASKYAGIFDFDVCCLTDHHPAKYIEAIRAANQAEYEVVIIDSLSHAWFSELELAGKGFDGWKNVRPLERALVDAMLSSRAHLIATMRTKTEWVLEEYTNKQGKTSLAPKKVGTAPIQASGIEFEFDLAGELNLEHMLTISKSRCPQLSNKTFLNPGEELANILLSWLTDGAPIPESDQEKCDRVKAAREAVGLDTESVKTLLSTQFNRTSPKQLSSEQVDELIALLQMAGAASE